MPHMKFIIIIMYYDQHTAIYGWHTKRAIDMHLMVLVRRTSNPYTQAQQSDARMVGIYLSYSFSNWLQWILISDKLYINIAEQANKSMRTQKRSPQSIVCKAADRAKIFRYMFTACIVRRLAARSFQHYCIIFFSFIASTLA